MTLFDDQSSSEISGLLLVDKPAGPTSHDIVHALRKKSGIDKVGHGGTLDPLASGLLPLFLGEATKMSGFIQAHDKSYSFDVSLGVTTDTDDSQGTVVARSPIPEDLSDEKIREVLQAFVGEQWQEPPMYSAVKQKGVPLYKLARKGMTVERDPRLVTVHSLEFLTCQEGRLSLRVHCSKGTYVRVLARQIGDALGCGGHVSRLRRLTVGRFSVEGAVGMEVIENSWNAEDLGAALIGPEKVFLDLPSLEILPNAAPALQKGGLLPGIWFFRREGLFHAKDTIRIMGQEGKILGLAEALLNSEELSLFPGGIPVAKIVLLFRTKSAQVREGKRIPSHNENG